MKQTTKLILTRPKNKTTRLEEAKVLKYFRSMNMRTTALSLITGKVPKDERG